MAESYTCPRGRGKVKWVDSGWVEDRMGDMRVLDVQPNIHDYIQEHIPGAVYLNENFLRSYQRVRPGVCMSPEAVEAYFRRVGLRNDTPVVVYTGVGPYKRWGDGLEQTMVAYCLARYGHDQIYILDGGIEAWKAEGRPLTQEFPQVEEGSFEAKVRKEYFIDYEEFREIKDRDDVILLDARPRELYEGQGPWRKPGHIPGAISLPWPSLMMKDNTRKLKPDEEILESIASHGIEREKTIICSCGTGREATNEFLLFKWYLRYPKVRIYEGSFTEWTMYPENPTVTGPSPR